MGVRVRMVSAGQRVVMAMGDALLMQNIMLVDIVVMMPLAFMASVFVTGTFFVSVSFSDCQNHHSCFAVISFVAQILCLLLYNAGKNGVNILENRDNSSNILFIICKNEGNALIHPPGRLTRDER
jgi:hypothetical protein